MSTLSFNVSNIIAFWAQILHSILRCIFKYTLYYAVYLKDTAFGVTNVMF